MFVIMQKNDSWVHLVLRICLDEISHVIVVFHLSNFELAGERIVDQARQAAEIKSAFLRPLFQLVRAD